MSERTILIVDDDDDMRFVLRGLLEPLGRILDASNGPDALKLVKAERPALMLLDVSLPGMDGLAVLAEALKLNPKLPTVMLTGDTDVHMAKRALDAGARAYITKPFEPATMCAEIKRLAGLDDEPERTNPGRPWRVRR